MLEKADAFVDDFESEPAVDSLETDLDFIGPRVLDRVVEHLGECVVKDGSRLPVERSNRRVLVREVVPDTILGDDATWVAPFHWERRRMSISDGSTATFDDEVATLDQCCKMSMRRLSRHLDCFGDSARTQFRAVGKQLEDALADGRSRHA